MPKQESIVKAFAVPGVIALFSSVACANLACAQSAVSTQPVTPLQLQVPAQPVEAVSPAAPTDNAIVDAQDAGAIDAQDSGASEEKSGPQVHGSFTTGIGYSKGYGTSTMNAADLDVSGQTDSGRSYDVHLHVMQSKGPGFSPYAYGLRYR